MSGTGGWISRWREGPFVVVDCAGLPGSVVESELFGHVRGSFTGAVESRRGLIESADGGTLFLDEVGELSLDMQGKLLRVLEEGVVRRVGSNSGIGVRFRVISATNRDLGEAVEAGRFRRDLYHRLKGVLVRVPSLRERVFDIGLLVGHYMGVYRERYGVEVGLGDGVLERLEGYSWPGNVRELRNVVEALVVGSRGGLIRVEDVEGLLEGGRFESNLDGAERLAVERAIKEAGGNRTVAARILGISRTSLWRKMRRFGMYRSG